MNYVIDSNSHWESSERWIREHAMELSWEMLSTVAKTVTIDGNGPFPLQPDCRFFLLYDEEGEAIAFRQDPR